MSLTVAAILLAFVAITTPIFARAKFPELDLSLLILAAVLLLARGPEPAQTYVLLVAFAMAVLLFSLTLKKVSREALSRVAVELMLFAALTVALVLAEFVLPDTPAVQMPMLALTVILAGAFVITGLIRGTTLLVRALRQKPKST